nr:redoxin domain-containing protein [Tepidiforma sp.]
MAETATLKVGDEAPDFELPMSPTGEKFKLSDYRGKNAVIINFVPAAFSPVCSNQLPLIEQKGRSSKRRAPSRSSFRRDGPWALKAWKEAAGGGLPVLSDFNPLGETARKYGVLIEGAVDRQPRRDRGRTRTARWRGSSRARRSRSIPDYDPVLACAKG